MAAPRVSIVTATYRRPLVLRHAIASVLAQDMPEWELIVVGDGCRDDTAEVVQGFGDPRIRWVNLPENSGGQSAPNSEGMRLARAPVLAFLNQDDMWFPNHLSRGLAFLERSGADLAWCPVLLVRKADGAEGPPDPERDVLSLDGVPPEGVWRPDQFLIASSWLVRMEAAHRVGPWRPAEAVRVSPSQDWLFRADRAGLTLRFHPHVSVVCLHAGARRGSYLVAVSAEHERVAAWVAGGPALREAALEAAALRQGRELAWKPRSGLARRLLMLAARVGLHPLAVLSALRGGRRGEAIARHRARTGSAPPLAPGEEVAAGLARADPFFGAGWHEAEGACRWTAASAAEILLAVPSAGLSLELDAAALREDQAVAIRIGGQVAAEAVLGRAGGRLRVALPGAGEHVVMLEAPDPASPRDLYGSTDPRRLGVAVTALRLVAADQPEVSSQALSASGGANSGMSSGSSGTGASP